LKILTFSLFNTEKSSAKSRGLCLQSASPLKGTLFFLLSFNLLLLEFIFYRGKIDRLRRIFFKR